MARVLVIENDRVIARDLAEILSSLGHELTGSATTFSDGVALVEQMAPDLVLIDIQIDGDRDGIALATELREEHVVAIAFITSHADHLTIAKASAVRPNGYLVKPFDDGQVEALVSTALANHSGSGGQVDGHKVDADNNVARQSLNTIQKKLVSDYVERHLDRAIKIETMADLCKMSPSEFSKRFSFTFGMTPYQFVTSQRMGEAKRLLRNTVWPIAEIATAVGFANQSHFTSAFRKSENATPLQYRKFAQ
ncbi:response regulator transcription factor [uncultured Erythrobacter sp.]|uniref:response regulator transcription factor n=1 Tax=uncultured Erythrobacter sp. TaxID=263913 RepID=UPI002630D232|nr:response regulator transcription factor [uncultured Erythrobacter sp.]